MAFPTPVQVVQTQLTAQNQQMIYVNDQLTMHRAAVNQLQNDKNALQADINALQKAIRDLGGVPV